MDEFAGQEFDFVITVCDNAKESCPAFPGRAERIHWSFDDPAAAEGHEEERLAVFRRVRDEISARLRDFADQKMKRRAVERLAFFVERSGSSRLGQLRRPS